MQEQGDVSGTRFLFTSCLLLQLSLTTDWEGRWWKVSFLTPSFLQRHLNFSLCSCSRCCTTERKVKHLMALLMVQNCLFLKVFFFRGIVPSIQFFLAYLSLGGGGRPPSLWLPFSFLLRGHSHSQPGLPRGFLLVGHTWNTSPRRCTGVLVRCADHLMWLLLICRSSL